MRALEARLQRDEVRRSCRDSEGRTLCLDRKCAASKPTRCESSVVRSHRSSAEGAVGDASSPWCSASSPRCSDRTRPGRLKYTGNYSLAPNLPGRRHKSVLMTGKSVECSPAASLSACVGGVVVLVVAHRARTLMKTASDISRPSVMWDTPTFHSDRTVLRTGKAGCAEWLASVIYEPTNDAWGQLAISWASPPQENRGPRGCDTARVIVGSSSSSSHCVIARRGCRAPLVSVSSPSDSCGAERTARRSMARAGEWFW